MGRPTEKSIKKVIIGLKDYKWFCPLGMPIYWEKFSWLYRITMKQMWIHLKPCQWFKNSKDIV